MEFKGERPPKPPHGCLTASATGCYGKPQAKTVLDTATDDWNRFGTNSDLSNSWWGEDIDWGGVIEEGLIVIVPGADVVVCGIRGCSNSELGMAIIGIIPAAKLLKILDKLNDLRKAAKARKVPNKSPDIDPRDVAGKNPSQIDEFANDKGLVSKGPDPAAGKGAYTDPVTGNQRILTHPNPKGCAGPHCHVNNSAGQRLDIDGNVVPPESPAAHLPLGQ